jgi:spore coat protein U-like protein
MLTRARRADLQRRLRAALFFVEFLAAMSYTARPSFRKTRIEVSLFRYMWILLLLLAPSVSWAAARCTITTLSGPGFGNYDPNGANATSPLDATGSIVINCNGATNDLFITIDQGVTPDAGSTCGLPLRQMSSGADRLRYDLYQDAAHNVVWGCNSGSVEHIVLPHGPTITSRTIYGRILPGQNVASGGYSDTVGVSVSF